MIESRDPYESADVGNYFDLVQGLAREGNEVTLFLVQNAVLPARKGASSDSLTAVIKAGIEVLAVDFSLRERAIDAS